MKEGRSVYIFLLILTGLLITVGGCLFSQNANYQAINRNLILQNDSLMGVLIEKKQKIEQMTEKNLPKEK